MRILVSSLLDERLSDPFGTCVEVEVEVEEEEEEEEEEGAGKIFSSKRCEV